MIELIAVAGLVVLALILIVAKGNHESEQSSASNVVIESNAYETALDEIKNNSVKKGLWTIAYANTEDEESRKKYYVRERARQIIDQAQDGSKGTNWPWIIMSTFVCLVVATIALREMGFIDNPLIWRLVGEGLIGGGSALVILAPLYIIKKVWDWIKNT